MNCSVVRRLLFFALLAIFSGSCDQAEPRKPVKTVEKPKSSHSEISPEKRKLAADYLDNFIRKSGFSGAVLVGETGKTLYSGAAGYANYSDRRRNETATPFQLASVSKQFTAVSILMLKERGLLRLEDSIQCYFPDFPYHGITIRMLLQHRSGLPNYIYFCDDYLQDKSYLISNSFVMALLSKAHPPAYYPPDVRFDYSNTGYMVLASLVEKISHMPYAEFLKQNIFVPLGMKDAFSINQKDPNQSRAAFGHHFRNRPLAVVFLDGVMGDKGIYASVEDLFKWDQALYDGKLLKPETLEVAFTPGAKKQTARQNYGYGWRIYYREDSLKILYHAGWWQGFESMLVRIPEKKTTMVFLKNTKSGPLPDRDSLINLLF